MTSNFFYRIDGFDLFPGNKTAGFCLSIATPALIQLVREKVPNGELDHLMVLVHERLGRLGNSFKKLGKNAQILFVEGTACPRAFISDPSFGGSIGADPETFSRLMRPHPLDWIGPEVEYTPHNCDAPAQAMILMVLAQTWAEYAQIKLHDIARAKPAPETYYVGNPDGGAAQMFFMREAAERSNSPIITSFDSSGREVKVYALVDGEYVARN